MNLINSIILVAFSKIKCLKKLNINIIIIIFYSKLIQIYVQIIVNCFVHFMGIFTFYKTIFSLKVSIIFWVKFLLLIRRL